MAKRRKSKARRSFSRARASAKRVSKRARQSKMAQEMTLFGSGAVYGGLRAKAVQLLSPILNKIPLGQYADNVGMGLVAIAVRRNSSGMVRKVAETGLAIEGAMLGSEVAQNYFNKSSGNSNSGTLF